MSTTILQALSSGNPFPTLDELRAERPVCPVRLPDGSRVWLVTRYEDARAARPGLLIRGLTSLPVSLVREPS